MDPHCGGFYDEVLSKYGRATGAGLLVYEKFARIFSRLPLASVVDDQVFVVHGGLSRNPAGGFLRLLRANRSRTAEVPSCAAYASAVELAFVDAMWADPQEGGARAQNPKHPRVQRASPHGRSTARPVDVPTLQPTCPLADLQIKCSLDLSFIINEPVSRSPKPSHTTVLAPPQ